MTSDKKQAQRNCDTLVRSLKCNGKCCERHPGHMTSGQVTLLRKLCLLHVTSVMETYSPLHQTGCNWSVSMLISVAMHSALALG